MVPIYYFVTIFTSLANYLFALDSLVEPVNSERSSVGGGALSYLANLDSAETPPVSIANAKWKSVGSSLKILDEK